jgi:hypothetical protein
MTHVYVRSTETWQKVLTFVMTWIKMACVATSAMTTKKF